MHRFVDIRGIREDDGGQDPAIVRICDWEGFLGGGSCKGSADEVGEDLGRVGGAVWKHFEVEMSEGLKFEFEVGWRVDRDDRFDRGVAP